MIAVPRFDRKQIIKSELQEAFDNIESAINTTKISRDQLGPNFVEFRHIGSVPKVGLMRVFGYPGMSTFAPTLTAPNVVVEDSILEYSPVVNGVSNKGVSGFPSVMIRATVRAIWDWNTPEGAQYAHICHSTDNGATWHILPSTQRHFGQTCGKTVRVYSTNTAPDYMGQGGPYGHRLNMPFDRGIVVAATYAGDQSEGANAVGKTHFALAIDTSDPCFDGYVSLLWGTIELNGRG